MKVDAAPPWRWFAAVEYVADSTVKCTAVGPSFLKRRRSKKAAYRSPSVVSIVLLCQADRLADPTIAGRVLAKLAGAVPARRWNRKMTMEPPRDVASDTLSDPRLDAVWRKQGTLELATLGSGNHFAELQVDGEDRLWLMVHSGSRAMGPAIRDHHLERAQLADSSGLRALDANSVQGLAYLHDTAWARRYAAANRQQIAMNIGALRRVGEDS
jgi:tRNA-splicing ligase RtcB (3'-phosphate/5'-hydroxy nucleic acid ligase)